MSSFCKIGYAGAVRVSGMHLQHLLSGWRLMIGEIHFLLFVFGSGFTYAIKTIFSESR